VARIRSVKPEFWTDRKLARLSRDARLLYVALWNQSDEHGRLHGDARYVKGHCLPYDDDLTLAGIDRLIDELAAAGHVVRYEVEGDPYLYLPKLAKHQRLDARVDSRLPDPPSGPREADAGSSEPDADSSVSHTDESVSHADKSVCDTDSSEQNDAKQVAGSRWQVAGGRDAPPVAADAETEGQRVNRLAKTYTDRVPLSNFTAVTAVIRKAVRAGPYTDRQLADALTRLADDNRSVTADSLRIELEGRPLRAVAGSPRPPVRTFTDEDYTSGF
jgi:hypothetical protein